MTEHTHGSNNNGDELTHINAEGRAKMVDVSGKAESFRVARAEAIVLMKAETLERITAGQIKKGDVLAVAQVAGVMGAKRTPDIIPMCHPLLLSGIDLSFKTVQEPPSIIITSEVKLTGQTGVEMEALTAVSIAALTVYDMCKAIDKGMTITSVRLLEKQGGKSGHFVAET